jgi:vancomycin permeability regulator SanA
MLFSHWVISVKRLILILLVLVVVLVLEAVNRYAAKLRDYEWTQINRLCSGPFAVLLGKAPVNQFEDEDEVEEEFASTRTNYREIVSFC